MVTGLGIPAAAVWLQRVPVHTVTLVAAWRVHAAVFAGPRLHATLVQILVACLSHVSWVTFALVWSHTLSMFTALLAVRFTSPPVQLFPAPAALHAVSIATESTGQRGLVRPAVVVQALAPCPQTEARQENYGQHPAVLTRDTNTSTARVS